MRLQQGESSTSQPTCLIINVFSKPELSHLSLTMYIGSAQKSLLMRKDSILSTDLSSEWLYNASLFLLLGHTWLTPIHLPNQNPIPRLEPFPHTLGQDF